MKQLAVYTVIIGQYDQLLLPLHRQLSDEADFFCFTDDEKLASDFFHIVKIERKFANPTVENRFYKINSHSVLAKYPYTLYIDGSVKVIARNILDMLLCMKYDTVAMFRHPKRDCIYREGEAVIEGNKEKPIKVIKYLHNLKTKGYPKQNGMAVATVILRNNQAAEVRELCKLWWDVFMAGPKRDQLSFNYLLWKLHLDIDYLPGTLYNNPYFKVKHHDTRPIYKSRLLTKLHKLKLRVWARVLRYSLQLRKG